MPATLLILLHQKCIWSSSIQADQGQRASPAPLPQIAPSQLFQVAHGEVKIAPPRFIQTLLPLDLFETDICNNAQNNE